MSDRARYIQILYRTASRHRRKIALLMYTGVSLAAFVGAHLLRFELAVPQANVDTLLITAPILLAARMLSFGVFRLSMERWRHIGLSDVVRLVAATSLGSALFFAAVLVLDPIPRVPRSIHPIDWMLVVLLVAGAWLSYRTLFEAFQRRARLADGEAPVRRVLVIGAGEGGSRLVKEMLRDPMGYRPVGFVDDDSIKWETRILGLPVLGGTEALARLAVKADAEELIIALPSAPPPVLRRIVEACEVTGLPFKVLPSTEEVLSGRVGPTQLRRVKLEDLLGRDPVRLELPALRAALEGRTVLITGAAGSIGSELARQVAANGPACLVILDRNESELYFVDLDLRREHPAVAIVTVVGDLLDEALLSRTFHENAPDVVFHAAAFKHVPLMEHNPRSAVRNNVLGTALVADAAGEAEAERFVLISTDKAVRPTSVMGATKRAAELVVMDCARRHDETAFSAVRFGNVLGSRGSVVPLFERQLAAGLPLTVTHPEVTRYFMTIAEAVQLVLQASLLPEARGRIAMLEMGDPVKILDLARKLIRLKGLREGVDARIEFGGLRPGEKLHEELAAPDEATVTTAVERVRMITSDTPLPEGRELQFQLRRLRSPVGSWNLNARAFLRRLVPGYDGAADLEEPTPASSAPYAPVSRSRNRRPRRDRRHPARRPKWP
ncbi:MAG: polysaccharide biosynthesis protein [Gemmatimonadetes bacterium]|nr:polysaccharide biosynthesis protein [Gemmatimonadota bacterium]